MAGAGEIFRRIEKKYIVSAGNYPLLRERLAPYVVPDAYGESTICNIYYDTERYDLIQRSIEKPLYKEKLRLRSYGVPDRDQMSFLEIKKKYKGVVYKRRISLPLWEAEAFLEEGKEPESSVNNQILKELKYFIDFYQPQKAMFIAYDRVALYGAEDSSLRITFDANVRARKDHLELDYSDEGMPYFEEDERIMEIKCSGAYPLWLVDILTELEIYPGSFSKYGSFYKREVLQVENKGGY